MRLSGRKFFVAVLSSLKEKAFKPGDDNISSSDLGVGRLWELLLSLGVKIGLDKFHERLVLLPPGAFEAPEA